MLRLTLIILSLIISTPSYAQHITGLEIEDIFKEIETLYNTPKPDWKKIVERTDLRTTEDAVYTHELMTNKRTEPIHQEQTKEELLQTMRDTTNELLNSNIRHTLRDIKYLDDKISAEVKYTSLFRGDVKMPGVKIGMAAKYVIVGFKTLSICTEYFRLENELVKSYRAECKIDTIYDEPRKVE